MGLWEQTEHSEEPPTIILAGHGCFMAAFLKWLGPTREGNEKGEGHEVLKQGKKGVPMNTEAFEVEIQKVGDNGRWHLPSSSSTFTHRYVTDTVEPHRNFKQAGVGLVERMNDFIIGDPNKMTRGHVSKDEDTARRMQQKDNKKMFQGWLRAEADRWNSHKHRKDIIVSGNFEDTFKYTGVDVEDEAA